MTGVYETACWRRTGTAPGGDRSCPRLREVRVCVRCEVFSAAAGTLFERELTDEDLAASYAGAVESMPAGRKGERLLLVVAIGEERFGLEATRCRKVLAGVATRRLPRGGRPGLRRIANADGLVVPCLDVADLLGSGMARSGGWMVLVEIAEHVVGLPVDTVHGMVACAPGDLRPPPAGRGPGSAAVTARLEDGEGVVICLDLERLLDLLVEARLGAGDLRPRIPEVAP